MHKDLTKMTEVDLILAIFKCDKEMTKMMAVEIEHYPGVIMGLGDFYVEKHILMSELLRRRSK